MSIAAALAYEHQVDQMVNRITHVASNGIWDPNKLANPPVQTITTTGTGTGDYPTHWYDPNGNLIWPQQVQPLPVVTVPNINISPMTFDQVLELVKRLQADAANPPEEKKAEEPEEEAKPVERKFVRVLEP
jgi:uncharacterized protein YbjT (DUF2867 family)